MPKALAAERIRELSEAGENACWIWRWAQTPSGYGYAMYDGRMQPVHRISYVMHIGDIPDGLHIDHLCRNKSCTNPAHLEAVPQRINNLRADGFGAVNARKTHCKSGHDITNPDNVWVKTYARGCTQRICKQCKRAANRAYGKRKRTHQ